MFLPSNVGVNKGSINKVTQWIKKEIIHLYESIDKYSFVIQDIDKYYQIIVMEVQCNEPDCVPIETLIIILYSNLVDVARTTMFDGVVGTNITTTNIADKNGHGNNYNSINTNSNVEKVDNALAKYLDPSMASSSSSSSTESSSNGHISLKWSTKIMKPIADVTRDDIICLDLPVIGSVKDDDVDNDGDDCNDVGKSDSKNIDNNNNNNNNNHIANNDNLAVFTSTNDKSNEITGDSVYSRTIPVSAITRVQMKPKYNATTTTTSNTTNATTTSNDNNYDTSTTTINTKAILNHHDGDIKSTVEITGGGTTSSITASEFSSNVAHSTIHDDSLIKVDDNVTNMSVFNNNNSVIITDANVSTLINITEHHQQQQQSKIINDHSSRRTIDQPSRTSAFPSRSKQSTSTITPRHAKGSSRPRGCPCCDPDNIDNIIDTFLSANIPHH